MKKRFLLKILSVFLVLIALSSFGSHLINAKIKDSEAFKSAVLFIQEDTEINKLTGGIEGYSYSVDGNIYMNEKQGGGIADLRFTVIGKENNLEIEAHMTANKENNWKITNLQVIK